MRINFTTLVAVALAALRQMWPRSMSSLMAAERRVGRSADSAVLTAASLSKLGACETEEEIVLMGAEMARDVAGDALAVVRPFPQDLVRKESDAQEIPLWLPPSRAATFSQRGPSRASPSIIPHQVVGTFSRGDDADDRAAGREVGIVEIRGPDPALIEKLKVRRLDAHCAVAWRASKPYILLCPLSQGIVQPIQQGRFLPGVTSIAFACDDMV